MQSELIRSGQPAPRNRGGFLFDQQERGLRPREPRMAGRPSAFTQKLADTICERLSLGESLRSICRDERMPSQSMVFRWLADRQAFREQYAHAREVQADSWADDIIEIADDSSGDTIVDPESGNERFNGEFAARSRLKVDTRKWLMARMAPKKYGDKVTQEHVGEGGGPVMFQTVYETKPNG